jgi:hypothetical protein
MKISQTIDFRVANPSAVGTQNIHNHSQNPSRYSPQKGELVRIETGVEVPFYAHVLGFDVAEDGQELVVLSDGRKFLTPNVVEVLGEKPRLSEKDYLNLDGLLGHVLHDFRMENISQSAVKFALTHIIVALDCGNLSEARKWLAHGRRLIQKNEEASNSTQSSLL